MRYECLGGRLYKSIYYKMYVLIVCVITDPSLLGPERNKMVIGACGLLLGVVFIAAGLIYYRKKSTGEETPAILCQNNQILFKSKFEM